MKELLDLIGVIPSMNIPFTEDDHIDIPGLKKHVNYAIESGVVSMMIPVVASEVTMLSPEERREIVRATIEETAGRIPVIGGASAATKEQCLAYAQELIEDGCEGILANIPYENDAQYTDYVHALDDLHPGFLMIQDYDLEGKGVPLDLIVKLYDEVDSFRALKIETKLPGPKFTEALERTGGKLNISGGWSVNQYIEGLDRGVQSMVPTGMHEVYCKVDKLYREGRRDMACKLYNRLQPVLCYSNQDPGISIHFYKRMLWKMGYYATPNIRVKAVEFDDYFKRIADDMIALYLEVSEEVKSGMYD